MFEVFMGEYMHILLIILKIIGIILLSLFSLGLLLILLAMFVPVRYRIKSCFPEMKTEVKNSEESDDKWFEYDVIARLKWLAGIVYYSFEYPSENEGCLRVFGIRVLGKKQKEKKPKDTSKKVKKPKRESDEGVKQEISKTETDSEQESKETITQEVSQVETDSEQEYKKTKQSKKEKKESRIGQKLLGFKKTIRSIKDYINIIFGQENRPALTFLKGILFKLLKHVKPGNIKADMVIGVGEPDSTGLLFGGLGILYGFWPGKYNIEPDFYNKRIVGKVVVSGRIRACVLLHYFIKVLRNEDVKRMRKQYKKARS